MAEVVIKQEHHHGPRNTKCFICCSSLGTSGRGTINIFEVNVGTSANKVLADTLTDILGFELGQESVHSHVICKKCYKLLCDINDLEVRIIYLKSEVYKKYHDGQQKDNLNESGPIVISVDPNQVLSDNENDDWPNSSEASTATTTTTKKAQASKSTEAASVRAQEAAPAKKKEEPVAKRTRKDAVPRVVKIEQPDEDETEVYSLGGDSDSDSDFDPEKYDDKYASEASDHVEIKIKNAEKGNKKTNATKSINVTEENLPVEDSDDDDNDDDDDYEEVVVGLEQEQQENEAAPQKSKKVEQQGIVAINKKTKDAKKQINAINEVRLIISEEEDTAKKSNYEYGCILCKTKFGELDSLVDHLKSAHQMVLHLCTLCDKIYTSKPGLKNHQNLQHSGPTPAKPVVKIEKVAQPVENIEGEFQCDVCNKIFNNSKDLTKHNKVHNDKKFQCKDCGKVCKSAHLLKTHENSHKKVKNYTCEICTKDFVSKTCWDVHMKIHQIKTETLKCRYCDKYQTTPLRLERHEKLHNGRPDFPCSMCDKTYVSVSRLKAHMATHSSCKRYICNVCGKPFRTKPELGDHERTHTKEKPYQCELCGMSFGSSSNLRLHKRAVHYNDRRYVCEFCNKGFKLNRLLKFHITAVHKGEKPLQCPQCTSRFVYPWHLKKHMRIHTGEKPYTCEICGKAFNTSANRNAHRFIHSNKKPYECSVCGKGFMRKPQLFLHMKNDGHASDAIVVNQAAEVQEKSMEEHERQEVEEQHVIDNHHQVFIESTNEHVGMTEMTHHQPVHVFGISDDGSRRNDRDRVPHVIIEGPISFAELEGSVSAEHMPHHMNYGVNPPTSSAVSMVTIPTSTHMIPVSNAQMYQRDMSQVMMGNRIQASGTDGQPMIIQLTVPKHEHL